MDGVKICELSRWIILEMQEAMASLTLTLLLYQSTIIMKHVWIDCESEICDVFYLAERMGYTLVEPYFAQTLPRIWAWKNDKLKIDTIDPVITYKTIYIFLSSSLDILILQILNFKTFNLLMAQLVVYQYLSASMQNVKISPHNSEIGV